MKLGRALIYQHVKRKIDPVVGRGRRSVPYYPNHRRRNEKCNRPRWETRKGEDAIVEGLHNAVWWAEKFQKKLDDVRYGCGCCGNKIPVSSRTHEENLDEVYRNKMWFSLSMSCIPLSAQVGQKAQLTSNIFQNQRCFVVKLSYRGDYASMNIKNISKKMQP